MRRTVATFNTWGWRMALCALLALGLPACATQASAPKATPTPIAPDARLAGQLVYVTVGMGQDITSPGLVEALDAQTGEVKWKAQQSATSGPPVDVAGALYVGSDDGTVRAYDAASGQPKWSFTRTQGVSDRNGRDAYVAVNGGVVYATSDSGAVYAIDAATGKQKWVYALPTLPSNIWTNPAFGFNTVYITCGGLSGAVIALDSATGQPRWSAPQGGGFNGQPTLVGGVVYAGAMGSPTFDAFDAHTGAALWNYDAVAAVRTLPAVGQAMVYIGAVDGDVSALRMSDHSLAWKFQTGGDAPLALVATGAAPLLDGQTLYVTSAGGEVYALDATTGKQQWKVALHSAIDSAPALVDGTLFVATEHGDVVALRARDGARIWHISAKGIIIASPLVTPPAGTPAQG